MVAGLSSPLARRLAHLRGCGDILLGRPAKKIPWLMVDAGSLWCSIQHTHMVVSINGGTPIAGWFIMENPIKLMICGYPYLRTAPYIRLGNSFWIVVARTCLNGNRYIHIEQKNVERIAEYGIKWLSLLSNFLHLTSTSFTPFLNPNPSLSFSFLLASPVAFSGLSENFPLDSLVYWLLSAFSHLRSIMFTLKDAISM